jgi:hypothetical protein
VLCCHRWRDPKLVAEVPKLIDAQKEALDIGVHGSITSGGHGLSAASSALVRKSSR